MPHYADGTEAKLGDHVRGKPYNTPHEVTGVVVGVVPDSESCNVRVAFARPLKDGEPPHRAVLVGGYDPKGGTQPVAVDVDYGETKAFTKIA
jgi:hypothetical protein